VTGSLGLGIDEDVRRAIAEGEIELRFQPIASITTGRIEAAEALVYWRHPDADLLSASLSLPVAEASASAWLFTLHVIELAASHVREWLAAGYPYRVTVNVPGALVKTRLLAALPSILREFGVPPRSLSIEITEASIVQDASDLSKALAELAELGLGGITIDHLSTEHSSIGALRNLPIDSLKLDSSLIAELDQTSDPLLVRSIIGLGHYLGLRVIAEGAHDEQTWRVLAALGCDAAQGDWLTPPLPAEELTTWLKQYKAGGFARVCATARRRDGAGARAAERIARAFDRAPSAMLMSDHAHRWVAINAAARALLEIRSAALLGRHVDETAFNGDDEMTRLIGSIGDGAELHGTCDIRFADGAHRRVSYVLRPATIPRHHVWILQPEPADS
jgi:EAL domain-containing protein (putative c-di-GMP-specific phosphodiesterase class I)